MESYWDGDNGNSGNNRSCCCDPWRGDSEPLPMLFKVCSAVREQSTRTTKERLPCIGCQSSNISNLEHLLQVSQLISQAANLVVAVSLIHQCGFCFCTMFFNSEQDSEDIPVLNHHINLLTPATPASWSRGWTGRWLGWFAAGRRRPRRLRRDRAGPEQHARQARCARGLRRTDGRTGTCGR